MKKIIFFLSIILVPALVFSQLKITTGTSFTTTGNVHIVLADMDFLNNGTLDATGSTVKFSGVNNSNILGNSIHLQNITVDKPVGKQLNLLGTLYVNGQVNFISGNIELNDKEILLGSTGSLVGESETSRATSNNYGFINANGVLNAPNAVNLANLGLVITSPVNIGLVSITRNFDSQDLPSGGKGIKRNYDIFPTVNANLNATITIKYFDAELNGLDENSLTQFHRDGYLIYSNKGFSARDAATNYVTQAGYDNLYKVTLSNPSGILPVTSLDFSAKRLSAGKVQLDWKTAQEFSNAGFFIERKTDKENIFTQKSFIASKAVNGNSAVPLNYQLIDTNFNSGKSYYRIKQTDLNGACIYSTIRVVDGAIAGTGTLSVWPIPAAGNVHIKLEGITKDVAQLWDAAGRLINQLPVENGQTYTLDHLSAGTYFVRLVNNKDLQQKLIVQ